MDKAVCRIIGRMLLACEFPLLLDQHGEQHELKRGEMGQEM